MFMLIFKALTAIAGDQLDSGKIVKMVRKNSYVLVCASTECGQDMKHVCTLGVFV